MLSKKIRKNANIRRRKNSDSEEGEAADISNSVHTRDILQQTKELQRFRERQSGVSATALAEGKILVEKEETVNNDPWKLKTGGLVDINNIDSKALAEEDIDVTSLRCTFSAETKKRDEDFEMLKYIEQGMSKQVAKKKVQETAANSADQLYELPDYLSITSEKNSEDMLSNQMLSGIPEVELGIEAKIKNIEATEDAKLQLLRDKANKKQRGTSFVPTNMAVNFVQHNRFYTEDDTKVQRFQQKKSEPKKIVDEARVGDEKPPQIRPVESQGHGVKRSSQPEKATDDYHYEKFKKMNTRRF